MPVSFREVLEEMEDKVRGLRDDMSKEKLNDEEGEATAVMPKPGQFSRFALLTKKDNVKIARKKSKIANSCYSSARGNGLRRAGLFWSVSRVIKHSAFRHFKTCPEVIRLAAIVYAWPHFLFVTLRT